MKAQKFIRQRIILYLLSISQFFLILLLPLQTINGYACQGDSCTGLNPESAGCGDGAITVGSYSFSTVRVDHRRSPPDTCDAEWSRAVNISGGTRYVGASIRYGAGFVYHQSDRSPAPISNGSAIYSRMKGPSSTLTLACGKVSTSLVLLPVTENCVGPY